MIFNVTNISSVVICNSMSEYQNLINTSAYDDFTLYIVEISSSYLLLYYGRRRLTDILVVDSSPPSLPESPINKLYLLINSNDDSQLGTSKVYYKYLKEFRQPKVAELVNSYIKEYSAGKLGTFDVTFSDNSKATVILGTDEGLLPDDVLQSIVERIKDRLVGLVGDSAEGDIYWYQWE